MSLRSVAHEDLNEILNDPSSGGWPVVITPPVGSAVSFQCWANDIHLTMDPGTGELVAGRQASIALLNRELISAGFDRIGGIADPSSKPWVAQIEDINGRPYTFKVVETYPDNGAGLTVLFLEVYVP